MDSQGALAKADRDALRETAIRGRLAFALTAAGRLLSHLGVDDRDIREYLEALWQIVETDDLMNAFDALHKDLPAAAVFWAAEDGTPLPEQYRHLHPDVPRLLDCLVWIGTGEFFGSVTGYAEESYDLTLRVADLCARHGVPLPPLAPYASLRFEERIPGLGRGWGHPTPRASFGA